MQFINFVAIAAALATSASATSLVGRSTLDVFVPKILTPTAKTVWVVGTTQTVTWRTSDAPVNITNKIGQIQLAQNGISTPVVLATGFNILNGKASFVVPDVVNSTYQIQREHGVSKPRVAVFGDSGNFSPNFQITGSDSLFSF